MAISLAAIKNIASKPLTALKTVFAKAEAKAAPVFAKAVPAVQKSAQNLISNTTTIVTAGKVQPKYTVQPMPITPSKALGTMYPKVTPTIIKSSPVFVGTPAQTQKGSSTPVSQGGTDWQGYPKQNIYTPPVIIPNIQQTEAVSMAFPTSLVQAGLGAVGGAFKGALGVTGSSMSQTGGAIGGQVIGRHRGYMQIQSPTGKTLWVKTARRSRRSYRRGSSGGGNRLNKFMEMAMIKSIMKG